MATTPPYTLVSKNGNVVIDAQTINTANSSLALAGKNYSGWGAPYAQNFLSLVENFASNTAPANPRRGQLWYDVGTGLLKVYDSGSWGPPKAPSLENARTISISGAATGSGQFDGSADLNIPITLALSGVTAGSYLSANITVDQFGRITSATNGLTGNDIHTPVTSFNTRIGDVTLTFGDVTTALGFTPANSSTALTGINATMINNALGYTPANDAAVVHKAGDSMFGILNMQNNRIAGLGAPATGSDAARFTDVLAVQNAKTTRVFQGGITSAYSVTVSPNPPSGGSNGDVWYRY